MEHHKRVGDDLYLYKGNDVLIIENFYDKKNKEKHKIFGSHGKKILGAIFLIGIVLTAYFLYTSVPKNSIPFSILFFKITFNAVDLTIGLRSDSRKFSIFLNESIPNG